MPQEFQVLQCFSCKTFQVHQVKKAKKWSCKLCGEKQSVVKVYGRGTGAECRQHVQKLNTHRGELDSLKGTFQPCQPSAISRSNLLLESDDVSFSEDIQQPGPSGNKWEQFVEDNTCSQHNELDSDDNFEDGRYTTDASIFERQKKNRKRKRQDYTPVKTASKFNKYGGFVEEKFQQEEDLYSSETFVTVQANSKNQSCGTRGLHSTKYGNNAGIFSSGGYMFANSARWNKFQKYVSNVDGNFYDKSAKGDDEIDCYSFNEYKSGEKLGKSEQILYKTSSWGKSYNSNDQSIPQISNDSHNVIPVEDFDRSYAPIDQTAFQVKHKQTEGNKSRELLPGTINRKVSEKHTSKTSKWGQFLTVETEIESGLSDCQENSPVIRNSDIGYSTTSKKCEATDFDAHGVSKSLNYPLQRSGCKFNAVKQEFLSDSGSSCHQEIILKRNELANRRNTCNSKVDVLARSGKSKVDTTFGNIYAQKENISDKKQINKMSVFSAGDLTDEDFEL